MTAHFPGLVQAFLKKNVSSMTLVALLHTVAANGVFTTTHTHTHAYIYINRVVGYNKQSLQCYI